MESITLKTVSVEPAVLLARARQGDSEAFGELCRFYEAPLRRRARALCGDAVRADELAQDTLVSAWKSLARFDGRCQFLTWLCAILMHHHRGQLRSHWRRWFGARAAGAEFSRAGWADEAPQPDATLEAAERAAWVRQCLARLPARHREVVFLRFYNNESLAGIAAGLNCSIGTVKSRLFHALEKLRQLPGVRARRDPL
jgi:RNA polymerase sigma-70 factor, ECF subfamily